MVSSPIATSSRPDTRAANATTAGPIVFACDSTVTLAKPLVNSVMRSASAKGTARLLSEHDIDLRVFVLLGAPYVPAAESIEWTRRTVAYAAERGAAVVSIIPVRGGNGEMERLQALGHFVPPTLVDLEAAIDASAERSPAVVTADLWDAERLAGCAGCRDARVERMRRWNITGVLSPAISCAVCAA